MPDVEVFSHSACVGLVEPLMLWHIIVIQSSGSYWSPSSKVSHSVISLVLRKGQSPICDCAKDLLAHNRVLFGVFCLVFAVNKIYKVVACGVGSCLR